MDSLRVELLYVMCSSEPDFNRCKVCSHDQDETFHSDI